MKYLVLLIFFVAANVFAEDVVIGTQKWMPKNLDVSTYRDGTPIRHAASAEDWVDAGNKKEGAWCYYNNDPANGSIYGKLYNWYAVNDQRGLAPSGYHVPSHAEWTELENYLSSNSQYWCNNNNSDIAKSLAAKERWATYSETCTPGNNLNTNNSSGFSALPGGYRDSNGSYEYLSYFGFWWSSTENFDTHALGRSLSYDDTYVYSYGSYSGTKVLGFSVRCVKDENTSNSKIYYFPNSQNPKLSFKIISEGIWTNNNGITETKDQTIVINDFLKFQGNIKIESDYQYTASGKFYLENVQIPGTNSYSDVKLWEANNLTGNLDNNLINIDLMDYADENEFKTASYFAGIKIIPKKFELSGGLNSVTLKMGGEIWLQGTKNCNDRRRRTRFDIENLEFTLNSDDKIDISFDGGINGLGFGLPSDNSSKLDLCINESTILFNTMDNKLDFKLYTTFGVITSRRSIKLNIGFINGKFNNGGIEGATEDPIPLGNLPIGLSKLGGEISGLQQAPLKLGLWAGVRPTTTPKLFEFDIKGDLLYNENLPYDNKFCITGSGHFFQLTRQGNIDEWIGEASISGCWYWNKDIFDISTSLNIARIKGLNGQFTDNYIFEADASLHLTLVNNQLKMNGQGSGTLMIPYLQTNQDWWCIDCILKNYFNEKIGGKSLNVDFNYSNGFLSGIADFSNSVPEVGKVNFKYNSSDGRIEISKGNLSIEIPTKIQSKRYNKEFTNKMSETLLEKNLYDTVNIGSNISSLFFEFSDTTNKNYNTSIIDPDLIEYKINDNIDKIKFSILSDSTASYWVVDNPKSGNWIYVRNDGQEGILKTFAFLKDETIELSSNCKIDSIHTYWNAISVNNRYIDFYISEDSVGFIGKFIGSVEESEMSFSFKLPDSLNKPNYWLFYHYHDSDSSLLIRKYLDCKLTNDNSKLNPPQNIKVTYNRNNQSAKINWELPNDITKISGYYLILNNTSKIDSVAKILNYDEVQTIVNFDIEKWSNVKMASFDENGDFGGFNLADIRSFNILCDTLLNSTKNKYYCDLDEAFDDSNPGDTIKILRNYNYSGDINLSNLGIVLIIGDFDFVLDGSIVGGQVRVIEGGYLSMTPQQNIPLVYPLTDGEHNFTVTLNCLNVPNLPVKMKINEGNLADGLKLIEMIDIMGEDNLNATITLRIDKSALDSGTLSNNAQVRFFDAEKNRYVPIDGNKFTIEDKGDYYLITITNVNKF